MSEHAKTAVEIVRAFTEAWTSKDLDTAGTYVADDAVFDGPLGHTEGKQDYLNGLKGLTASTGLTGANILAAYGDNDQAIIMYELLTSNYGTLTCAKLFTLRDGKIVRDLLTFDSYPIRKDQGK
jgi:limonene-1,2-epoxide hydrolase